MNIVEFYKFVNLDYSKVEKVLQSIGNKYCHSESKNIWSVENPTTGYCYKLCEVVSYHLKEENVPHKVCQIKTTESNHWFILLSGNIVLELTYATDMKYELGKGRGFFPCNTKTGMSLGAEVIAERLGII